MKLLPELIPKTSFFKNLRSELKPDDWDLLRTCCYQNAKYKCEICGEQGKQHPVECHEIWDYNMETGVQRLENLIALCPNCHEVKHHGLAQIKGRLPQVKIHLMNVNKISLAQAERLLTESTKTWNHRNTISWTLDLTKITNIL